MGTRRSFTQEFKHESARRVLVQEHTIKEAGEATGAGETAIRHWVKQLRSGRNGLTPQGSRARTKEQQRIQELEKENKQRQREKEILKRASALFLSDSWNAAVWSRTEESHTNKVDY